MKTLCVVASLVLLPITPLWATDTPSDRATLKGLKAVGILVESLTPEMERDSGLTSSQLQTDVELRLRQAGIRVDDNLAADEYLYVNVTLFQLRTASSGVSTGFAYVIDVEFNQSVVIVRTGQRSPSAATWSVSSLGTTGLKTFSEPVRSKVRDHIDQFINAFLSVNPKP